MFNVVSIALGLFLSAAATHPVFKDFDILIYREVDDLGDWGGPPSGHIRMLARKRR